jgi:hypothetical protein
VFLKCIFAEDIHYSLEDINNLVPWKGKPRAYEDTHKIAMTLFSHYLFRQKGMQQIFDGFPYIYTNPRSGEQALMCLVEKVGSTEWKSMLLKSLNVKYFYGKLRQHDGNPHTHIYPLPVYRYQEFKAVLENPNVPRILFVRNPYNRLLSGWLDKQSQEFYVNFNRSAGTFEHFSYHLRDNRYVMSKEVNDHFHPAAFKCFGHLYNYDYYLKVEHMDYWYPGLIKKLGLEKEAKDGWDYTNLVHNSTQPCFYVPRGDTCETALETSKPNINTCEDLANLRRSSQGGKESAPTFHSVHGTGSASKLEQYYSKRDMIDAVNQFSVNDFEKFKYPMCKNATLKDYISSTVAFQCTGSA